MRGAVDAGAGDGVLWDQAAQAGGERDDGYAWVDVWRRRRSGSAGDCGSVARSRWNWVRYRVARGDRSSTGSPLPLTAPPWRPALACATLRRCSIPPSPASKEPSRSARISRTSIWSCAAPSLRLLHYHPPLRQTRWSISQLRRGSRERRRSTGLCVSPEGSREIGRAHV